MGNKASKQASKQAASAIAIPKLMDKPAIEKAIESIGNRGAKLDKDIQLAALSIVAHIDKHREVSLAIKLYKAMPQGMRRNALVAFFLGVSMVEVNMDKETKGDRPLLFDGSKKTDMETAVSKPWFKFVPEKSPDEAFNPDKFISIMQSKLRKLAEKGELPADDRLQAILALPVETKAA